MMSHAWWTPICERPFLSPSSPPILSFLSMSTTHLKCVSSKHFLDVLLLWHQIFVSHTEKYNLTLSFIFSHSRSLHIITEFRSFSSKLNYFKNERESESFENETDEWVKKRYDWMWNTENNGSGVISEEDRESNIHTFWVENRRERLHLLYFSYSLCLLFKALRETFSCLLCFYSCDSCSFFLLSITNALFLRWKRLKWNSTSKATNTCRFYKYFRHHPTVVANSTALTTLNFLSWLVNLPPTAPSHSLPFAWLFAWCS